MRLLCRSVAAGARVGRRCGGSEGRLRSDARILVVAPKTHRGEVAMPAGVPEGIHEGFNSEKWAESVFLFCHRHRGSCPRFGGLGAEHLLRAYWSRTPRFSCTQLLCRPSEEQTRVLGVQESERSALVVHHYPLAIFYCIVNKRKSHVSIFHTMLQSYPRLRRSFPIDSNSSRAGTVGQSMPSELRR